MSEATELHTFALAYERALTEVMMSEDFRIHPQISHDIGVIIRENPNPLIKVDLLMDRLKGTELGKKLYVKAIFSAHDIRFDRELSKREQEREQQGQIDIERRIKMAAQLAAQESARIGEQRLSMRSHLQTAAEQEYALTHPSGTYKQVSPAQLAAEAASAPQYQFQPFALKKGKGKGGKKSHRKKSHRKKSGKKSHRKSRRH